VSDASHPRIIFFNIGWMRDYKGPAQDDPTRGNFAWLRENAKRRHGHECYNFADDGGFCYGCHAGYFNTAITRLGALPGAPTVDGILAVWFSRDPKTDRAVIVGWYRSATVYREFQQSSQGTIRKLGADLVPYKAKAKFRDCFLLPVGAREFEIPSRYELKGGYGQNPNWYGSNDRFLNKVWQFTQEWESGNYKKQVPKAKIAPRNIDHELRQLIEETAIRAATEHYSSPSGGSRVVVSVESQAKGWDLEATGSMNKLLVEVKGLGGGDLVAELTPNEFAKMQKHKGDWVLFVVTQCKSTSPRCFEFRYMHDARRWETPDGHVLEIEERIAAVVCMKT
jgi:Domain of unknown function (DUF3883)